MFMTKLQITQLDGRTWELLSPLIYRTRDERITVPAEFKTDLTSVPRILRSFVPVVGKYTRSAVLHDYLYIYGYSRRDADRIMLEAMKSEDVNILERYIIYFALRGFNGLKMTEGLDIKALVIGLVLGTFALGTVIGAALGITKFWWGFINSSIVHQAIGYL